MRNMYIKKNSGITLIALVITIIILMILVGVTISMVFNGGILEKANMSAEQYSINQAKEELELAIANLQMEEIRRGDVFTKEDLTKLNSDVISVGSTESFPIEIVYGKYKFKINELFKATYAGEAEGTIVTYTTNPKGYTNADEVHVLLNIENPIGIKEVIYPDDDDSLQCNGRTEVTVDYTVNSNGIYKFKVISSDNKEVTKEVVIDTIDRLDPQSFSITGETTRTGVKINGVAIDAPADGESICSGINRYEYYVRKSGSSDEYTKYEVNPITELEAGTYTVYAIAYDMAGNSSVPTQTIEVEAPEEWIEIYDEEGLRNIASDLTKNYILMADIELTQTWTPIGNSSNPFTGKFDGDNHKITGLENGTSTYNQYHGLFGCTSASISNLQLEGDIIGYQYLGILAGINSGTITNVKVTGTVSGSGSDIGGLVGSNNGTITQSYVTGTVSGSNIVGGLVGSNVGEIIQSYATGEVRGTSDIGGLVGANNGGKRVTITQSYATGTVSGYERIGGLVGSNGGEIIQSYATGAVKGSGSYVGGLVGSNLEAITESYATGDVTGAGKVGGLVGENRDNITLTQVYATGEVSGSNRVGGLVGSNRGPITQAYATGTVSGGTEDIGGLVGYNVNALIKQAYATGQVNGKTHVGGLVGYNLGQIAQTYAVGEVTGSSDVGALAGYGSGATDSYWTSKKSGVTTSLGEKELTLEQMQTQASYVDWDFDTIWIMREFPELRF